MKIQFEYIYRDSVKSKFVTVDEVANMIRGEKYKKSVAAVREAVMLNRSVGSTVPVEEARQVPVISWGKGDEGYTGYVMLSLPCRDEAERERLHKMVSSYLQVVCSFSGSSGQSYKIIMAFEPNEGGLQDLTEEQQRMFHATAFCRAAAFLQANTGLVSSKAGYDLDNGCRVSSDAAMYLNTNVVPLKMDVPETMPDDTLNVATTVKPLVGEKKVLPDYSELERTVTAFNLIRRNLAISQSDGDAEDVVKLAEACAKAGLLEEVAVKCALSMNRFEGRSMLVRSSFERAYVDVNGDKSGAGEMIGKTLSKSVLNIELMQRFLMQRYRFRRNEVTGSVEYQELCRYVVSWRPFTERERNTICMETLKAGIDVWDRDIDRYVNSSLVEEYDPIAEWLNALPEWDGRDRVGELAATLKTEWGLWPELFATWLRSMVRQWKGGNGLYGATMVLMLTGAQGVGKSTFLKRLLPPELSPYYLDRLDFTNKKEAERALIRFCLINLDEFDQISASQTACLKHMLQKSEVMYRRIFQSDIEQKRRYAAFCATTNSDAPLTDPTGSRRYLVVEVAEGIDMSYEIDYEQLYAQLLAEVRVGKASYFDTDMERLIQEHNANYTEEIPLVVMFDATFRKAKDGEAAMELSSTEIIMKLKEKYKSGMTASRSMVSRLGRCLANKGIHSVYKDHKRTYSLVEL